MGDPKRIAIVGGGITGLTAAYVIMARLRARGRAASVTLFERTDRFGGNLVTEHVDGFLLDGGPDSWVVTKPHATALARELGLGGGLIGTSEAARRYFVAWDGRLHPVPESLVLGVPTRLAPLARTPLFSWRGKLRMALEPFVPARRFEGDEDESIAAFAARRLGQEASDRLVAPLLGGISAGDASDLSVRAGFPQLVAMERDHGSLVRGMIASRRARAGSSAPGPRASAFTSLEQGVGALVAALVRRLQAGGVELRSGATAAGLSRAAGRWVVAMKGGGVAEADALLIATPAHVAARLMSPIDERVASALGAIRYSSTATVFLAYRSADVAHPLDGVGFVVPRSLGRSLLAATWVSSKWPGRAPPGHALIRAFFGGAWGEDTLAREDEALARLAQAELRALMGLEAAPLWSRVFRFDRVSAQMRVGHLAVMRGIRDRLANLAPPVHVAGGGYDGVGIPDCVRQGEEAGRAVLDAVDGGSVRP